MRTITFSEDAQNDIEEVCDYLQQRSEAAAEKLLEDIAKRIQLRSIQPGVGRLRGPDKTSFANIIH